MLENDEIVENQALDRALSAETAKTDLIWVMNDPRGRRFIKRLLESSGIYRSSYSSDSGIYFREGERNVGLRILSELERLTPENYIVMLQENLNE